MQQRDNKRPTCLLHEAFFQGRRHLTNQVVSGAPYLLQEEFIIVVFMIPSHKHSIAFEELIE